MAHLEPSVTDPQPAEGSDAVGYTVRAGVATITMDQPATRNALTPELLRGLVEGIGRAEADAAVRVVVLTHTGPVWCAGADLRPRAAGAPIGPGVGELPAVLEAIARSPLPFVARLTGPALGGGVGLAAVCDISVASAEVMVGFTEVRLGVVPAVVSVVCLARMRRGDALELFLTGERVPAARAVVAGLLTASVPAGDLDATVDRYVTMLCAGGPAALAASKALVHHDRDPSVVAEYGAMAALSAATFATDEAVEGRAAFRERRPAAWVPPPGA